MVTPVKAPFGTLLRRYRLAAQLTQEELAERANLSVRAISDLERGLKQAPRRITLQLLADALQLSEEDRAALEVASRQGRRLATPPPRINLPLQPTPFIGRQREVEEVTHLLRREEVRLLTLTGPGGVGKTRLAVEVAGHLAERFPDGVHFVSLASLVDPELVPSTIATTLGLQETSSGSILQTLLRYLEAKQLLLILDNFEHLLPAAETVWQLVATCPRLTILVTSRATLHLLVEQEYPVPPLVSPDLTHLLSVKTLSQYDAVTLFIKRAQAVRPSFQVTDKTAPAVAEICSRLDGLPLAIELAAARIKVFSPQALLQRLASRLTLLTGGPRDLPARQQTMRATMDWSYNLLSKTEQTLFARLSVFAGGCTLGEAEAVCSVEGDVDLLEGLASLVDASLLRQQGEDEPRFSMLETIREYAQEKLEEQGERRLVRQRHASYFLTLTEDGHRCSRQAPTGQVSAWLDRLEREHDNLRAALAWLLDTEHWDQAVQLSGALSLFWDARGYASEGYQWLERALQGAEAASEEIRARALIAAGFLGGVRLSRLEEGTARCTEALELYRRLGDRREMAGALTCLGIIAHYRGDRQRARDLYRESLAQYRALGDRDRIAQVLVNLGPLLHEQGDLEGATTAFEDALELVDATHSAPVCALALIWLGHLALMGGKLDKARRRVQEGLEVNRQVGHVLVTSFGLCVAAGIAVVAGQSGRAAKVFGAESRVFEGRNRPPSRLTQDLQQLLDRGREAMGVQGWDRAWEEGEAMTLEQAIAYVLEDDADR